MNFAAALDRAQRRYDMALPDDDRSDTGIERGAPELKDAQSNGAIRCATMDEALVLSKRYPTRIVIISTAKKVLDVTRGME